MDDSDIEKLAKKEAKDAKKDARSSLVPVTLRIGPVFHFDRATGLARISWDCQIEVDALHYGFGWRKLEESDPPGGLARLRESKVFLFLEDLPEGFRPSGTSQVQNGLDNWIVYEVETPGKKVSLLCTCRM